MHISLAIATIGRTVELVRLLESLCAQTYTNFDVIICDQNSEGYLDTTLEPFAHSLNMQCVSMSPCGVSAARNALFPYITGDIVAFPDDDCWYGPDTLAHVVDFFARQPQVGGLFGVWSDDFANVQTYGTAHPLKKYALFNQGGTLVQFYRRGIIDAVGGFDEVLGPGTGLPYGCGEDTDYALRAAEQGEIWRAPTVHVYHPKQNTQAPNKEKLYAYACGRMYLLRKHKAPLWFVAANVLFPLYRLVVEGPKCWKYRWYMFFGRLRALVG